MAGRNRVNVKVVPDTTGFAKKLKADLNRIEKGLKVKVKVEVDTRLVRQQIQKAARDQTATINVRVNDRGSARQMAAAIEKASPQVNKAAAKSGNRAGTQFGRGLARGLTRVRIDRTIVERAGFTLGRSLTSPIIMLTKFAGAATLATTALGPLMGAVAPLVSGVTGLASALGTASGALLAIPALAGAAGAAIATLVVGMQGFGTALKAESAADFEKAIADMTPAARGAARAFRGLKPAFSEIRKATQENLFKGLSTQIKGMGRNLLPALKSGMGALASGLNNQLKAVFQKINTQAFSKDLEGSFKNFGKAAENAAPAMANLVDIFGQLMRVGSELLPGMGKSLSDMTGGWLKSIKAQRKSGKLLDKMKKGFEAIKSFGRSIKNTFKGISNVLKIADKANGGFLKNLERGTKAFEKFTESAEGKEMFGTIFESFKRAGDAMMPVFKQIGKSFATIAPALADIAEAVAPALEEIVKVFGDTFKEIGPELGDTLGEIGMIIADMLPSIMELVPPFLRLFKSVLKPMAPVVEKVAEALGWLADRLADLFEWLDGTIAGDILGIATALWGLRYVIRKMPKKLPILGALGSSAIFGGGKGGKGGKAAKNAKNAPKIFPPIIGGFGKSGKAAKKATKPTKGFWKTMGRGAKAVGKKVPGIGWFLWGLDMIPAGTTRAGEEVTALDRTFHGVGDTFRAVSASVTGNVEAMTNLKRELGLVTEGTAKPSRELEEMWANTDAAVRVHGQKAVDRWKKMGVDIQEIGRNIRFNEWVDAWNNATGAMLFRTGSIVSGINTGFSGLGRSMASNASRTASSVAGSWLDMSHSTINRQKSVGNFWSRISGGIMQDSSDMGTYTGNIWTWLLGVSNNSMSSIGGSARAWFGTYIPGAARSGAQGTADVFGSLPGWIRNAVGNVRGIGAGIANDVAWGIWGALDIVRNAAEGIGAAVRGALPNSPAKYGPLSGRGYPRILGQNVSNFVAQGIEDATPAVKRASTSLAGSVHNALSARTLGAQAAYGAGASWVNGYADGIESQADRVRTAVAGISSQNAVLDSNMSHEFEGNFDSVADKVAEALSQVTVEFDQRGVGRMSSKYNRNRRRR